MTRICQICERVIDSRRWIEGPISMYHVHCWQAKAKRLSLSVESRKFYVEKSRP